MNIEDFAQSILDGRPWVPALTDASDRALSEGLDVLGISRVDVQVLFDELLINGREHGRAGVQVYLGKLLNFLLFAVRDHGIGIHESVPKNPKLADTHAKSASAILRLACEEGITGTGTIGRGIGLHLLAEFCERNDAQSLLVSDGGRVLKVQDVFIEKDHAPAVEGTLICIVARLT